MGNAKMETNRMCQTSESYIVASLISKGLRLRSTDWSDARRSELLLSDPQDEPYLVISSMRGQATCNPADYAYCLSIQITGLCKR